MRLALIIAALAVGLVPVDLAQNRPADVHPIKLWAAITVSQPIFDIRQIDRLQVNFAVFNEGDQAINPKLASSHFFVNGAEQKDWCMVIGNGPKSSFEDRLPPGRSLLFSYALSKYFMRPGVYTIRWEGEHFRTREVTFRVVPRL